MATTAGTVENFTEVARHRLRAEECAVVIVDIQERLLPHMFNGQAVGANAQLLVRLAGILQVPVLFSTQYAKGLGPTIPELAALAPDVAIIDKVEFNCFDLPQFCEAVKALPGKRNTLLMCGMEAHVCVLQTALGALENGYIVHVASDAIGSRVEWNWRMAQERMAAAGCLVSTTEIMMYEMLGRSGTPAFKEILKYVK